MGDDDEHNIYGVKYFQLCDRNLINAIFLDLNLYLIRGDFIISNITKWDHFPSNSLARISVFSTYRNSPIIFGRIVYSPTLFPIF